MGVCKAVCVGVLGCRMVTDISYLNIIYNYIERWVMNVYESENTHILSQGFAGMGPEDM